MVWAEAAAVAAAAAAAAASLLACDSRPLGVLRGQQTGLSLATHYASFEDQHPMEPSSLLLREAYFNSSCSFTSKMNKVEDQRQRVMSDRRAGMLLSVNA